MSVAVNREWIVDIVERLPAGLVSRAWGFLVRRRRPRLAVAWAKRVFVAASGADLTEAEAPIESYPSLEELFVRRLRPGSRRIDPETAAIIAPVDGVTGACGLVDAGTLVQVKGRRYRLARLLDDEEAARRFEGGAYATFYLAPGDYHRIHAPISGVVSAATVVPGRLLPVFPESLGKVDELFARNERLITYLDAPEAGRLAVVKVGATLVGRIGAAFDAGLRTNTGEVRTRRVRYDPPHRIEKGGELGVFEFGSTVVLVAEPGKASFDAIANGAPVRVGMRIGTMGALAPAPRDMSRGGLQESAISMQAAKAPRPRRRRAAAKKKS